MTRCACNGKAELSITVAPLLKKRVTGKTVMNSFRIYVASFDKFQLYILQIFEERETFHKF